MKNSQIERWALEIIDRVEAHQPIEDSRVELKAQWPEDSAKAARRIAGHANAARGEHILWLIGVDEENGVVGADFKEMADWFARVAKKFDGLAPRVYDLNVPTKNGETIVALLFETDRAPFVVANPAFGNTKGEGVMFEVPWREGTKTRSATRSDLIILLSDTVPLKALRGELEWNAFVAAEVDRLAQFSTIEFAKAISQDALSILSDELRGLIFTAYFSITEAQGLTRVYEQAIAQNNYALTIIQDRSRASRELARRRIETALAEINQYLQLKPISNA